MAPRNSTVAKRQAPTRGNPAPRRTQVVEPIEEDEPFGGPVEEAFAEEVTHDQYAPEMRTIRCSYGIKMPTVQYGSQECHVESTIVCPPGAGGLAEHALDDAPIVRAEMTMLKAAALEQVGVPWKVSPEGVIQAIFDEFGGGTVEPRASKPRGSTVKKSAPARGGRSAGRGAAKSAKPSQEELDEAWAELLDDGPDGWYDNRDTKQKDSQPDFKRKSDGLALWLNSAPEWFDQVEFDDKWYGEEF